MGEAVFLITGASRGIGLATARLAAEAGYRLVLAARDVDRLTGHVAALGGPDRVRVASCDVRAWEQLAALVGRVEEEWGRLDVVFANAGASVVTSFTSSRGAPPAQWGDMVLTNVCGPAFTARAALPALIRSGGHLVLTGSAAGRGVRPGNLYAATKWAVTGLAQAIRAECVGTGVRVTLVQPGLTDTEGIPASRAADPKLAPADVARAVLYAVSQPATVDVNEILVRPVGQDAYR
ncbi:SDR family oxidoreductase [Saccharothrix algeriensis]|uniref:NADP-dependent 3-hydroxy acid dehydrogenase YdfG n=1 Tax=Saccharothrix algeriensis TaxID=173560 RepID=A0A8T8HVG1_9PSEU|nr:SDR family oxidoreductase [Saccharothrix algeriensis]MBM7813923.1 NADP-dependent 3-hydroxy acid dehydrogenase YdfG [Saccharothrix algeriensis]QTR02349.1 SDR family oxidoreductase [Saccharothrix algeriensis]